MNQIYNNLRSFFPLINLNILFKEKIENKDLIHGDIL